MASGFSPNSATARSKRRLRTSLQRPRLPIHETRLCAVCLGHNVKGLTIAACGADKVYLIDDPAFLQPIGRPYVAELVRLVKLYKPRSFRSGRLLGRCFSQGCRDIENRLDADDRTGYRYRKESPPPDPSHLRRNVMPRLSALPAVADVHCPPVFKKKLMTAPPSGNIIKVDFDKDAFTSKTQLLNFVADLTEKSNWKTQISSFPADAASANRETFN